MKKEILEQLTWKNVMEIYECARSCYLTASIYQSDKTVCTEALNRLKEKAK